MGSLYNSVVHEFTDLEKAGVLEVTIDSTLDSRIFGGSGVPVLFKFCWV